MQILPNIHAVKIPFQIPVSPEINLERFVYVYVIDSERLCLIDSGVTGTDQLVFDVLKRRGRKLSDIDYLLLTHSHPDHIGAAKEIKAISNCSIWSHPAAQVWVEDVEKQFSVRPVPGFYTLVSGSVKVDQLLEDGDTIDLGGLQLQVIHTPGHSICSNSFFCNRSGVLFTGDAIPQGNDLPIYDDVVTAVKSIRKLKKVKGVKTLLTSWSDPLPDYDPYQIMDDGLHYFQKIHSTIRHLSDVESISDPMDLCRQVVEQMDLPEIAINPLVAKSLYSHIPIIDQEHM